MNEESFLKKQLIKYVVSNFLVFSIIFILIGSIVFTMLNKYMYSIVDKELLNAKDKYFKNDKIEINIGEVFPIHGIIDNSKTNVQIWKKYGENFKINNPKMICGLRDKNKDVMNENSIN